MFLLKHAAEAKNPTTKELLLKGAAIALQAWSYTKVKSREMGLLTDTAPTRSLEAKLA